MPLRVTVTVVPHGVEDASQVVGSIYIENVGGSGESGIYSYSVYGEAPMSGEMGARTLKRGAMVAQGTIRDFPRRRDSVWELLRQILSNHGPQVLTRRRKPRTVRRVIASDG